MELRRKCLSDFLSFTSLYRPIPNKKESSEKTAVGDYQGTLHFYISRERPIKEKPKNEKKGSV